MSFNAIYIYTYIHIHTYTYTYPSFIPKFDLSIPKTPPAPGKWSWALKVLEDVVQAEGDWCFRVSFLEEKPRNKPSNHIIHPVEVS